MSPSKSPGFISGFDDARIAVNLTKFFNVNDFKLKDKFKIFYGQIGGQVMSILTTRILQKSTASFY